MAHTNCTWQHHFLGITIYYAIDNECLCVSGSSKCLSYVWDLQAPYEYRLICQAKWVYVCLLMEIQADNLVYLVYYSIILTGTAI